ncbi:MAG: hypothetical protein RIM23_27075 [Coleofasciculus sp. G3-WIS-01]|uniref:hypothetical protein n=1 Tax=Coleofasciculus sp. G3-WIS-01 TaxID=3069528 RepID=UPI0032FDDBB4
MKTKSMIKTTRQVVMKLLPALYCVVLVALTWTGTYFNAMPTAHALTVKTTPFILVEYF